MTTSTLQADVYRRLAFAASPDSTVVTRILAYLNETQQEIMSEPGMDWLLNDADGAYLVSVASRQQYSLPRATLKIKNIWQITNRRKLDPMSIATYRSLYPDPASITGIPEWWVDLGFDATELEPQVAGGSTLFVISTSATDGAAVTAYLEGIRNSGHAFVDSKAMNGVTSVAFTYSDVVNVTKFYLSAAAVGVVRLRETSGTGTILSTIAETETMARYRRIALAPTPSSAITYSVEFERVVTDLVNANDEPILPPPFHRLLAIGARMKEYERRKDVGLLQTSKQDYEKGLKLLKHFVMSQSVGSPNMRYRRPQTDWERQRLTAW